MAKSKDETPASNGDEGHANVAPELVTLLRPGANEIRDVVSRGIVMTGGGDAGHPSRVDTRCIVVNGAGAGSIDDGPHEIELVSFKGETPEAKASVVSAHAEKHNISIVRVKLEHEGAALSEAMQASGWALVVGDEAVQVLSRKVGA
jgi:hypothetical protein